METAEKPTRPNLFKLEEEFLRGIEVGGKCTSILNWPTRSIQNAKYIICINLKLFF
jgi:hypothetical protein